MSLPVLPLLQNSIPRIQRTCPPSVNKCFSQPNMPVPPLPRHAKHHLRLVPPFLKRTPVKRERDPMVSPIMCALNKYLPSLRWLGGIQYRDRTNKARLRHEQRHRDAHPEKHMRRAQTKPVPCRPKLVTFFFPRRSCGRRRDFAGVFFFFTLIFDGDLLQVRNELRPVIPRQLNHRGAVVCT